MKRILSIIFSSIAVAASFVCFKYVTFGKVMPNANFGMRAICKHADINDLYLGSSMFRQGIDSRELGDSTYLLSYNSNRPFLEAMQLDHMINNGAKFKRLIMDMYPYSIARQVGLSDVKMIMDGDVKFTIDVYAAMRKSGSPISTLYDMLVLQNNETFLTLPLSFQIMNERYDRGSNATKLHGRTTEFLAGLEPHSVERETMTEVQADGLERIILMCRENNIELVFLETPKYKVVNDDSVYVKLMREFALFLSERNVRMIVFKKTGEKLSDIVNMSLVNIYDFDDENALFYRDLYHISFEGRQELSKRIKEILN